jgi:hypothetical protein
MDAHVDHPSSSSHQDEFRCCVVQKKKGENHMLQEYVLSVSYVSEVCCECYISMLQK